MSEHKQFEILCALAAVGQVSDPDLRDLKRHMEGCLDCQNRIADFAQISAQVLPLAGERYGRVRTPKAMTARFVERARAEGIPVRNSQRMMPGDLSFGLGWKGSLAGVLLLVAMTIGGISRSSHSRTPSADTAVAAKLGPPDQQPIHVKVTQNHFATQRARLLSFRRHTRMPNARVVETHESSSDKTRLVSPWLVANTEHDSRKHADDIGTDPRGRAMFATVSSNSPFHVFPNLVFPNLSDQFFSDGLTFNQSKWHSKIDWGGMRRNALVPNFNDLPQHRPGILTPEWPFPKDSKVEQQ